LLHGGSRVAPPVAAPFQGNRPHRRNGHRRRTDGPRVQERRGKAVGSHHGASQRHLRLMKRLPPNARTVAARAVERVARDAAFAAAALDAAIEESPQLSPEDHALATELAYGV